MPNYERGSTEPNDVRVFDGGEDDEEGESSHLPVVIVISLLVLACFGGVVWLAYINGVAHGRADVPTHVAATTSEAPATAPGNGEMPTKAIKVYQQAASADDNPDQEVTTAPEHARATPTLRAQPTEAKPVETAKPAETKVAQTKPVVPPPVAVTQSALAPVKPKPVAEAPATAPPAVLATATPKPAAASVAAAGAFVLQIGAYKSQDEALGAWKAYQAKHISLLGGYGPDVQKADLGDKGVWYRLRTGSFADKNDAAALCDKLKAESGNCFPAK